jgi:hypothetical protein
MPLVRYVIAAAAAACLIGGVAVAQPAPQTGGTPDNNANPPASDQSATPAPATTPDQSAPADQTAPAAAPTATGTNTSASVDAATGAQVIASAPVPDTPTNRAKYGKPMSRAGKLTQPAGN